MFDAAFSSAILYGSEAWIGVSLKPVEKLYASGVRSLLGVRNSTPLLTCFIEAGLPSLQALVKDRQSKFLRKMISQRQGMEEDDPLMFTLNVMRTLNPGITRHIDALCAHTDHLKQDNLNTCQAIRHKKGTKFVTYCKVNPELSTHPIYTKYDTIADNLRITFTRLRLSSHRLRIEIGRWSHIPAQLRFCPHCRNNNCEVVQDEEHVLTCPAVQPTLTKFNYPNRSLLALFDNANRKTLTMLSQCIEILEKN